MARGAGVPLSMPELGPGRCSPQSRLNKSREYEDIFHERTRRLKKNKQFKWTDILAISIHCPCFTRV
jgi:hypothetical protein